MTNTDIIDEIINCGISYEDGLLQFGAGYKDGALLFRISEETGVDPWDLEGVTGVDANSVKIDSLTETFHNCVFDNTSMQEWLDDLDDAAPQDWVVTTGVFDEYLYGDMQHNFVFKSIQKCFELSRKGTIFTLKMNLTDDFSYNPLFIFAELMNSYSKVIVKKLDGDNYVFCILK